MTLKEMTEVMLHFDNGGEVECKTKYEKEWSRPYEPIWDWAHYDYRIKPELVGIPATEEELDIIYGWVKEKKTNRLFVLRNVFVEKKFMKDYYKFNPDTKCWEEWSK